MKGWTAADKMSDKKLNQALNMMRKAYEILRESNDENLRRSAESLLESIHQLKKD